MERMKTKVELLEECCDIKDAACVRYQKRIAELEEENKKLKSDLANIQCEFGFACEEIDYRKREDKELRKWIKEHVDYQTQADFRKRFEHK